jgi:hypothetical protein
MGVFMKRFLCVCMCIFILTISVFTYFPTCVYAADDFTLSTAEGGNIPSDEANTAVNNKGDIYNANHEILFRYTPTSDYNWTYVNWNVHCSDAQVVACLRSNNKFEAFGALLKAGVSHNAFSRVMLSQLGFLVSENSELGTDFLDRITGNYNYLNAIEYDPNTGDLTLLADQVTALRNELKDIYYDSLGLFILRSEGTPQSLLSSAKYLYEHEEDFQSDYVDIQNRDYVFSCMAYNGLRMVVRYVFSDTPSYFYWNGKDSYCEGSNLVVMNSNFDILTMDYVSYYSSCEPKNISFRNNVPLHKSDLIINNGSYFSGLVHYYSDTNEPIKIWSSYEALYNYLHGSQNAYLSSKVEEAGEDIKLSINDLNENIGSKIDELIDSINNKKDGMTADELQKAIDKALDSISGKIDDIGDNTQQTNNKLDALLESVSGTNQILMQILGVTTDIRDIVKTQDDEGNQYTMSDVKNCFNTMFNNLKYSILYGKNITNNPDTANVSTAAYVSYSDISTYADTSTTLDYKDGLFGKFPFSVPYQMYEWLQVLQVDEKVPQFTYNYGFLIGQKGQEYDLTFDLTHYQPWADVLKSFLRLSFTLIMSVFIYNKFRGEM